MAYLTTLEGDDTATAPITINDLFAVNDFYGIKLFGDAWPDVKKAAAIIAQRAANSPIMFYIRSQANNNATPGKSSAMGRKLWGYNDRAGVELLGAPCWNAVKSEFDELLGWNPFSTVKKAWNVATTPFKWGFEKLEDTNIPIVSDVGYLGKRLVSLSDDFVGGPQTLIAEREWNAVVEDKGYYSEKQLEAQREAKKQAELQQMLKDQSARASMAASEAAKAQAAYEAKTAELEKQIKQYGTALEPAAQQLAIAEQEKSNQLNKILLIGGGVAVVYLLTRNRGK